MGRQINMCLGFRLSGIVWRKRGLTGVGTTMSGKFKRAASLLLTAAMLWGLLVAPAAGRAAPCVNHPIHDGACGYQAEMRVISPCGHVDDDTSGSREGAEEIPCDKGCGDIDSGGAVAHLPDCAYAPAVEAAARTHTHDGACGYTQALRVISPCAHSCSLCSATAANGLLASGHSADVTNLLKPTAEVTQNGSPVTGDSLTQEAISVKVSFGVPVLGDGHDEGSNTYVKQGDTAKFKLSIGYSLLNAGQMDLKAADGVLVGHVSFNSDDSTKEVTAVVTFDGENDVFGDGGYNDVKCTFTVGLQYDASGDAGNTGNHPVEVLGKEYTVNIPEPEPEYTLTKSGHVNGRNIDWTITVNATKGGANMSLAGYVISDDLSDVGVPSNYTSPLTVSHYDAESKMLTYTFPETTTGQQTLTFSTPVDTANLGGKITNTAKLTGPAPAADVLATDDAEVDLPQVAIEKIGVVTGSSGTTDWANRTITWSITVDNQGYTLPNAVITDTPTGANATDLTFGSATLETWDGNAWVNSQPITRVETGNAQPWKFSVGTMTSKVKLTVVTKVPNGTKDQIVDAVTYQNTASIAWDGGSVGPSKTASAVIGYNAIAKSASNIDYPNRTVEWKVSVDAKNQNIPDMKVFDLLVYGESGKPAFSDISSSLPDGTSEDTYKQLTPQYNQRYVAGSFANAPGDTDALKIDCHTIEVNGKAVADLLEISSSSGGGIPCNKAYAFTYKSEVVNPAIFGGNQTDKKVLNTACLFSENSLLSSATASKTYPASMLKKDALSQSAAAELATEFAEASSAEDKAFNYNDKSVVYRLYVNSNGVDFSTAKDADGNLYTTLTVVDTLPDGWKFIEFPAPNSAYFYTAAAFTDGNGKCTPTALSEPGAFPKGVTVTQAIISGTTATFVFNAPEIKAPFVIYLRAAPTAETANAMFATNQTRSFANKAQTTIAGESAPTDATAETTVSVTSKLLSKTKTGPTDGALTWTVEYLPYGLARGGDVVIQDTLPAGIDLRTDSSGKLVISDNGVDNISVTELTMNDDGTVQAGGGVPLTGENLSYDPARRVLEFKIPDSQTCYRLQYVTDITGEPGTVSNQVLLSGGDIAPHVQAEQNYEIQTNDASATMRRSGTVIINKKDGSDSGLADAEFTLYAQDGTTVIRAGITNASGKVTLRGIPVPGQYILRETKAPDSYELLEKSYDVTTEQEGNAIKTTIAGCASNTLTVNNFRSDTVGTLTLSKTVAGTGANRADEFTFTITLPDSVTEPNTGLTIPATGFPYIGIGVADGYLHKGANALTLKDGQSIRVVNLPNNVEYTVEETDSKGYEVSISSPAGSSVTGASVSGRISAGAVAEVTFTNSKQAVTPPAPPTPPTPSGGPNDSSGSTPPVPDVPDVPVIPPDTTPTQMPNIIIPEEALDAPRYARDATPSSDDPAAPDIFVLIRDDGVPLGVFTKTAADDGSYIYLNEEGIPLAEFLSAMSVPKTGDPSTRLPMLLCAASLAGIVLLIRRRKTD